MAVVKLGNKVKTNLPDTIRYVINPEKNVGGRLVYASYSSERHDANTLAEPMIRDLERCANGLRKDGVLALHLKHSFSPDEHVSAEQVHELGVMLTEAITGGDYKYVVSTHMDRHHLHNHIVICAGQEPRRELFDALAAHGRKAYLIGGADVAAELDAKRAIAQGSRLAATL